MKKNIATQMFNFLFNKIWGENPLTFYFSFDRRFNQLQLWGGTLITINLYFSLYRRFFTDRLL